MLAVGLAFRFKVVAGIGSAVIAQLSHRCPFLLSSSSFSGLPPAPGAGTVCGLCFSWRVREELWCPTGHGSASIGDGERGIEAYCRVKRFFRPSDDVVSACGCESKHLGTESLNSHKRLGPTKPFINFHSINKAGEWWNRFLRQKRDLKGPKLLRSVSTIVSSWIAIVTKPSLTPQHSCNEFQPVSALGLIMHPSCVVG